MDKFTSYVRTTGLFLLALLVGLLLPVSVARIQDSQTSMIEEANIEPVALSEDSGLLNAEKINILANESCEMTALSAGKHQDAASLSSAVWRFLEELGYYGTEPQTLLDTATAEQKTHAAWLVTLDSQAFIVWEVLFADNWGNQLRIYIDDESTLPLGMSYTSVEERPLNDLPVDNVLETLGSFNGLYITDVTQHTPEETEKQAETEVDMAVPAAETLFFTITLSSAENGEQQCTFPLEMDSNGFRINWVR